MAFIQKLVTERSFDANGALILEGHIGTFDENKLTGKEPHLFDPGDYKPVMVEQSSIAPSGPNPTMPQQIPPDAVQGPGGDYVRPGGAVLVAERTMDADARLADRLQAGDTSEGDLIEELRRMEGRTGEIRALLEQHRQTRETAVRAELASVGTATSGEGANSGTNAKTVEELEAEIARLKASGGEGGGATENDDDALVAGTVPQVTAELGAKTDDQLNAMLAAENDREKPRAGVTNAIQAELDARAEAAKETQPA